MTVSPVPANVSLMYPFRTPTERGGLVRLAGIKPGDIVRVHDGLPYLAEVIGHDGARVRVAPITGPRGVRTVTNPGRATDRRR
jgi:hypothetical protein